MPASKKKKAEPNHERLDQLRLLAKECNDALGEEGRVRVGADINLEFVRIPTGILAFDTIIGGGLVEGHLIELYGEESCGKTLLALNCVAAVQRLNKTAVWVKGEDFDIPWAKKQGVDVDKLVMVESATGDQALETAMTILESGLADVMVFDSYQALGTTREAEGGVDSEAYAGGGAPQLWGRVMRRAYAAFNSGKAKTCLIGISQVRDAIGGFSPNGKPEPKPTQIRALKHWKSISVQCKRGEPTHDDPKSQKKRLICREFHLKCVKNKTAEPDRVSSFIYHFRDHDPLGIDHAEAVMRLGKVYGLIEQKGGWLEGYGVKKQGEERFLEYLRTHPETVRELHKDILDVSNQ